LTARPILLLTHWPDKIDCIVAGVEIEVRREVEEFAEMFHFGRLLVGLR
jgi:hypothetical protein